jgi:hypothetical protein
MWVRFRAFNDAFRPDVGLWILRGGRAAAMSLAEGPPAHHAWIGPDTLQIVADWFETAGFRDLTQESYFNGGEPGRICEIFLSESTGVALRVIGDEAALPESVRLLARDLEGLATHILVSTPSGPPPPPPPPDDSTWVPPPPPPMMALRAAIAVIPQSAPTGTPRAIRLRLPNESSDSAAIWFRSTQIYDLVLVDGWTEPPHPPDGDSTGAPPDRLIWNWAHDRAFAPVETRLVLAPGGTVVYTETWDGKSNEGEAVGPGGYVLMAPIYSDQPVMNGMGRVEVTER